MSKVLTLQSTEYAPMMQDPTEKALCNGLLRTSIGLELHVHHGFPEISVCITLYPIRELLLLFFVLWGDVHVWSYTDQYSRRHYYI